MVITAPTERSTSIIRPVSLHRDYSQLVSLLQKVFGNQLNGYGEAAFERPVASASPFNMPAVLRFKLSPGFVWVSNGRIVGNATLMSTKKPERFLVANVAVHPDYRRQGIARALMDTAIDAVRKENGTEVMLQVVHDNVPAQNLYLNMGFEALGDITSWFASRSQTRYIADQKLGDKPIEVKPLTANAWRTAFDLDIKIVNQDFNWPESLPENQYRKTVWRRITDALNGRSCENWSVTDNDQNLVGLASIIGEWGQFHHLRIRVDSDWQGRLERPLLATCLRRFDHLPNRRIRIEHPANDDHMNKLLREANFTKYRSLTHMRLHV